MGFKRVILGHIFMYDYDFLRIELFMQNGKESFGMGNNPISGNFFGAIAKSHACIRAVARDHAIIKLKYAATKEGDVNRGILRAE